MADHIGMIINGKLLYQEKFSLSENLEQLFMEIVRKEGSING